MALRPFAPPGTISGNVMCTAACFVNAVTAPYDLWPRAQGPLIDVAHPGSVRWKTLDDFMGEERGTRPDAGAMERVPAASEHRVGPGSPRPPRVSGR
jgi:hypothetical protein